MSHKGLCRQQRSGCLFFLHREKETTKEEVKSDSMPKGKVSHFSIEKKQKTKLTTKKETLLPCIRPEQEYPLIKDPESRNNINRKVLPS